MKIAHLSDLHVSTTSGFDETLRVGNWIVDDAIARGVDLWLLTGDLFHAESRPLERNALMALVQRMAGVGPVVGVYGNHDTDGDLDFLNEIRADYPIAIRSKPDVIRVNGATIALLPWPNKASIRAWLGPKVGLEEGDAAASDMLRRLVAAMSVDVNRYAGPKLMVAHAMVKGAKTDHDQPVMGGGIAVSAEDLAASGAHYVALGHIHAQQHWMVGKVPVVYAGASTHRNYGEPAPGKGYVVVDISRDSLVGWERVAAPVTPMTLLEAAWNPATEELAPAIADPTSFSGHDIRLRYEVDEQHRGPAELAAEAEAESLRAHGAVRVTVDPRVRPATRARAPEVSVARGIREKLAAFWASRDTAPDAEVAEALLGAAEDLEVACGGGAARTTGRVGLRLESVRMRGVIGFPDEVAIDFAGLGPDRKIVALVGENGAGKSRILTAWPGSIWREIPRVSNLVNLATTRDALIESTFVADRRLTIRQMLDGIARKGEALILDERGEPVIQGTGLKATGAWVAANLMPPEVFFATQFGAQEGMIPSVDGGWKRGGFIDLPEGERKAVALRAKGIEHFEAMAAAARARVDEFVTSVKSLTALRDAARARCGDVPALEVALTAARGRQDRAAATLSAAHLELADVRAAQAGGDEMLRDHERRRLASEDAARCAQDAASRATAAREALSPLVARKTTSEALVARAGEIETASKRLAQLQERKAALATKVADIRATVRGSGAELDALGSKGRDLGQRLLRIAGELESCQAIVASGAERRSAAAALDGSRERARAAAAAVEGLAASLEERRALLHQGTVGRADALRGGLEEILRQTNAALMIAGKTLASDDQALAAAATLPGEIARMTMELGESRKAAGAIEAEVRRLEILAAGLPEVERAATRAAELGAELEQARGLNEEHGRALEALRVENDRQQTEADRLETERGELSGSIAALTAVAGQAGDLAAARVRLEELSPRIAQLEADATAADAEAVRLTARAAELDPGPAPAIPDVGSAEERVRAAELEAQTAASMVGQTERRLAEEAENTRALGAAECDLKSATQRLFFWQRLAADLGRDGIQAAEVGNAGPEIAMRANELLRECLGDQWTVDVRTERETLDGRMTECFEVRVFDAKTGAYRLDSEFSGGERALIGEAEALAIAMLACESSGIEQPTIVRDETSGLDVKRGPLYVQMLRKAAEMIRADRVLFVAHNETMQALADVRIHVGGGRVSIR